MEIKDFLTTVNFTKRSNRKIEFIVIHYTAGTTSKGAALANCKYYQNVNRQASAHYFVDAENIYRCVNDSDDSWHCGTKGKYYHPECRNSNSIGIEMCSDKVDDSTKNASDKDWYIKEEVISKTIELTKELMKKYNIPSENVIRHYDVTHKICPSPFVQNEKLWLDFKSKLIESKGDEEEMNIYKTINDVPASYRTAVQKFVDFGILKGNDKGELNLSEDMCRMLTILARTERWI